mmetsp:Transcript_8067/g.10005  ORF Transcript_8067/g.10005 Transcript_8067/m.10005 type:complete len:104 (-) Transcript_8067:34-345(-)
MIEDPVEVRVSASKSNYIYVSSVKEQLKTNDEVILSGLGSAIITACIVSEILKNTAGVEVKGINTSILDADSGSKAKIQITVAKGDKFEELLQTAEDSDETDE